MRHGQTIEILNYLLERYLYIYYMNTYMRDTGMPDVYYHPYLSAYVSTITSLLLLLILLF